MSSVRGWIKRAAGVAGKGADGDAGSAALGDAQRFGRSLQRGSAHPQFARRQEVLLETLGRLGSEEARTKHRALADANLTRWATVAPAEPPETVILVGSTPYLSA